MKFSMEKRRILNNRIITLDTILKRLYRHCSPTVSYTVNWILDFDLTILGITEARLHLLKLHPRNSSIAEV